MQVMTEKDIVSEMNAYYARRAPWHDENMGYSSNEAMEELLGPIIDWVEPHIRGRYVLEIACGTGNWTQVLSQRAKSVVATDVNASVLEIARQKPYSGKNVVLQVADAYSLDSVEGTFDAAFGADWWSHIPKQEIPKFLGSLLPKLSSGSSVVMIDMLHRPQFDDWFSHYDRYGNRIDKRPMQDGGAFHVVKNFPDERELVQLLTPMVTDIEYREHEDLLRWMLTFRTL
jgi:demethylmenaquinone methyltransferase/2-methoxy-6-polyprenyl-1,4-benzoquinol methylase